MKIRAYVSLIAIAASIAACHKSPAAPTSTDTTTTTTTTTTETQPVPTLLEISPAIGSADGGTVVTLTGTDFTNVRTVTFGGVLATTYTVDSDTTITATAPAGALGSGAVAVSTAGGTTAAIDAGVFTWDANVLTDLSFPAASAKAGAVFNGLATLRYPAPSAGISLNLAWATTPSHSTAVLFPLTTFVPGGSNVATFQVTTFYTSSEERLDVSSDHWGESKSASIAIKP